MVSLLPRPVFSLAEAPWESIVCQLYRKRAARGLVRRSHCDPCRMHAKWDIASQFFNPLRWDSTYTGNSASGICARSSIFIGHYKATGNPDIARRSLPHLLPILPVQAPLAVQIPASLSLEIRFVLCPKKGNP